ncbi:MAG TPA: hypothetical protein VG406_19950 [Isosphaeraceae bacterium]|jgi:hypothetical protein|nr:hypothetical protein [Isosphaeraceae bacterium]
MALERELATYQAHLIDLVADEGKYVVIRGEEILGPFASYEDALGAGYERFGPVEFLVKPIWRVEPIRYFTRDLAPWPS